MPALHSELPRVVHAISTKGVTCSMLATWLLQGTLQANSSAQNDDVFRQLDRVFSLGLYVDPPTILDAQALEAQHKDQIREEDAIAAVTAEGEVRKRRAYEHIKAAVAAHDVARLAHFIPVCEEFGLDGDQLKSDLELHAK